MKKNHKGMIGKKHSDETKGKMKETQKRINNYPTKYFSWKDKKFSKKHKIKLSEARKNFFQNGGKVWNKGTKGIMKSNKGCFKKGKLHFNWNGGNSIKYTLEFNNQLRNKIRQRDNFRCQECFRHQDELYDNKERKYKLSIHHIDYNKQNNQENNLISLCKNCHNQTNFNRNNWTNYFNNKI